MSWNGSDQASSRGRISAKCAASPRRRGVSPRHKKVNPSIVHLLSRPTFYIPLLLALLGGALLWIFGGRGATRPTEPTSRRNSQIASVTPAPARTNAVPVKKKSKGPPYPKPSCVKADKFGVERWPSGVRYVPNYGFRTNSINPYAGEKRIFKHGAEIHIASLLQLKPGNMIIGGFRYGDRFDENFRKSLEDEIEILPTDSEEERQLKRDVIQVKKELQQAMDEGRKPSDIMQEAREELVRAFQYKHNLEQQLLAIRKDKSMSAQDVMDGYEAANKMLEEKGIPGFSTGVMKRRFERLKQQELKGKSK